jgi:hypothetical protein
MSGEIIPSETKVVAAQIAMQAGVPVVPIAVVGAEESMPTLFRLPSVASLIGAPYVPVTANMLALGPLGAITYFPAKFKLRVLEPVTFNVPPDQERYSKSRVMDWSEAIRDLVRGGLEKEVLAGSPDEPRIGAAVYVYDHEARDLARRITGIAQHTSMT